MNLDRAAELIRGGVDINARNEHGESLLHAVIRPIQEDAERRAVVRFMLDHGADPSLICPDGSGPLFHGVLAQDTEVLRMLLDYGADPNREHEDGETLYEYAEFDYRHETYDLNLPEKPTDADKISEEAWLAFLDRLAVKYGKRRPDHLFLLRERGALKMAEMKQLAAPSGKLFAA